MDEKDWSQACAELEDVFAPSSLEHTEPAQDFSLPGHDPNMRSPGTGLGHDASMPNFHGFTSTPGYVMMPQVQFDNIHNYVQTLEQSNAANESRVAEHSQLLHDIVRFTEEVSATVQNFDTRITQVEATHNDAQEDTLHNYGQVQALRELNQVHVSHDAQVESTFDNVHDSFTRNLDQAQAEATHNQAQEQATLESAQLDATYSHAPLPVTPSHRTGLLGTPKSALRMPGVHSQSSASDALASPTPRPRRVGKPVMEDAILNGTASGSIKKARSRKKLHIKIPGDAKLNIPADGLPTPLTLISAAMSTASLNGPPLTPLTPITPATPGRIGPRPGHMPITKRKHLNLINIMPPAFVVLPDMPLTDTEIIVYFFSSVSRPVVATRLYSRKWGPKAIATVLNEHRDIDPPYLANTCSVKCSAAIKKGQSEFGMKWHEACSEMFLNADDKEATHALRFLDDEINKASDFDMRDLSEGIKKHPALDNGDGGIFTQCVMYCQEHNLSFMLSNAPQLAEALIAGFTAPFLEPASTGIQHETLMGNGRVRAHERQKEKSSDSEDKDTIMTSIASPSIESLSIESPCKGKGKGKATRTRASPTESVDEDSDESYRPSSRRPRKRPSARSAAQSTDLLHPPVRAESVFSFKSYSASSFHSDNGSPSLQDNSSFHFNYEAASGSGCSFQDDNIDPNLPDSSSFPFNYEAVSGSGSSVQNNSASSSQDNFQGNSASSSQDNSGSSFDSKLGASF